MWMTAKGSPEGSGGYMNSYMYIKSQNCTLKGSILLYILKNRMLLLFTIKKSKRFIFTSLFFIYSFSSRGATKNWRVQDTSVEGGAKDNFYPV